MNSHLIAICALAILPAVALGQGGATQHRVRSDTGQRAQQRTQERPRVDTVTSSAGGRVAVDRALGLDTEQVRLLQQALNATGCHAGAADGIAGPATRAAIRCAERQRNFSGTNINELLRAFGFHFTADTTRAPGAAADTAAHRRDTSATRLRDTTARRP